jgi:hypothetical protein
MTEVRDSVALEGHAGSRVVAGPILAWLQAEGRALDRQILLSGDFAALCDRESSRSAASSSRASDQAIPSSASGTTGRSRIRRRASSRKKRDPDGRLIQAEPALGRSSACRRFVQTASRNLRVARRGGGLG